RSSVLPAAQVWMGRGDPMSAGSALSVLGDALRRVTGVQPGEPIETRRAKIKARVARHLAEEADRVAWFLGEMLGTPFEENESVQIAAARRDSQLMADQMRRAFEDFVLAESAAGPLVLVLEDLHWGDFPTVAFVDSAVRLGAERPLMVLATARPDIRERFPRLWQDRNV